MTTPSYETSIRQRPISSFKVWLRAMRPESFPVSVVPVLLGIAIAWQMGYRINFPLAFITFVGTVAIHAATNLLQDYFDYRSGFDKPSSLGGSGVLVRGELEPSAIFWASMVLFCISAAIATILIIHGGLPVLWLVVAGFVLGAGYACPKYGLKYLMLGDVAVFLAFGIGITMGSYLIQTGRFDWHPLLCAVPFGFLVTALLHANNMRDMITDLEAGHKNLAYRLGVKGSMLYYTVLILGAYTLPVIFVLAGFLDRGVIVILITFPYAISILKAIWNSNALDNEVLKATVIRSAKLALCFGMAMVVGVICWALLYS